jgi:uncharacterized membrane protein YcaP (DUF421 family)
VEYLALSMSPGELLARGTIMYWFLFLIFRFVLRRDTGSAGISDILFVVLLGDAAQNGMIGRGETVADAALLIGVLVAWNYALDYLGFYFRFFEWLIDPPPICLVRNGRLLRRNLRREHLTDAEIGAKLRGEKIEHLHDVRRMYLESDGSFSVLKRRHRAVEH